MIEQKPITAQIFRIIKYINEPLLKIIPHWEKTEIREKVRDLILIGLLSAYQAGAISESVLNDLSMFFDDAPGWDVDGKTKE